MVIRIQPRAAWQAVAATHASQTSVQSKNAWQLAIRRHKATTRVPCHQHTLLFSRSSAPATRATHTTARHSHPRPSQQTGIYQHRASSSFSFPSKAGRAAAATAPTRTSTLGAQEQPSKSKFIAPDPNTDYWKLYQEAIKNSPKGVDGVSSPLLSRVVHWLRAKASPMTEEVATKLYELFLVHLRRRLYFQRDAIHELLAWYVPRNDTERVNKLLQPLIKEAQAGKKMRLETKAWMLVMLIKQGNEATAHQLIGPPETTWVPYFSDFERWTRGSLSPSELERARQVLYDYTSKRLQPNTRRFTHLLQTMFGKGKPEDALALYQDTLDLGFETSELVGSAMLSGLLNAGRIDDTRALWQRLHGTKAYRPAIGTYNNLLAALSHHPKHLALAEDLWRFISAPDNTGVRPDQYTFSVMINAYFRNRDLETALHLWQSMRKPPFEIEPNLVMYNTILTGLFRAHRPDLAKLEFEQMMIRQKELLSPRSKSKNRTKRSRTSTTISSHSNNNNNNNNNYNGLGQDTATALLHEDYDPETGEGLESTFNIMLKGLISVKDLAGVQHVQNKMAEFQVEANLETYTLVSDVLFSQRLAQSALKTVDLMATSGVEKSAITYSAMIAGLVKADQLERALDAFEDMKRAGFAPTIHVYGALIQGALCRGDLPLAEDMASQGKRLTPDGQLSTGAYGILIGRYMELNLRDRAMAWLLEMNRTTPHQRIPWTSYYALLRGCVEHKDWDLARQVLRIMDENQFQVAVPRLAPLIAQVQRESAAVRRTQPSSSLSPPRRRE